MSAIQRIKEYRESHGTKYTLKRLEQKAVERIFGTYDRKRDREKLSPAELEAQRHQNPEAGLISIVVPIYNTDPRMLKELLGSISAQTYENYEAILYDGCSTRKETLDILEEAKKEPRNRVIRGTENKGISGNTNAAIALARGEYCALCDHDDILAPDALWRAADCICREHPDLLYSDEDRIPEHGGRHMDPHYKPDYCPDNLVSDNYFCHLSVIRKSLLEEIGGLRSGFDGSQDHDLFLRLAEKTDKIAHLPYTLYTWRENFGSMSHKNLMACLENGCRAVEEHEARMGRSVSAVPVNKEIRLWYDIDPGSSVEAIIHGGSDEECEGCMTELAFLTGWGKLSGTIITGDGKNKWSLVNEAAKESEADYLLVMDARVGGMNRHFIREMVMYAQRNDVGGVPPAILDENGCITHGGFALGMAGTAQCINEGMKLTAGGWHDMMNKVHNVSAVSAGCFMVKRENWTALDEAYTGGLVTVDMGMSARKSGKVFVFTPHATCVREKGAVLLSGTAREAEDEARFRQKWGENLRDPCYSPRFKKDRANYRY